MNRLLATALASITLLLASPAVAQAVQSSNSTSGDPAVVPMVGTDGMRVKVPAYVAVSAPASSTAATGTVTSSAVTSTGGTTPVFSAGTATIPFTPTLGYGVRLILTGGATFTASVGTSVNACTTVNTLTAGGTPISYTGSVNEFIDAPATTATSIVYCLVIAVTSGTESYAVRN